MGFLDGIAAFAKGAIDVADDFLSSSAARDALPNITGASVDGNKDIFKKLIMKWKSIIEETDPNTVEFIGGTKYPVKADGIISYLKQLNIGTVKHQLSLSGCKSDISNLDAYKSGDGLFLEHYEYHPKFSDSHLEQCPEAEKMRRERNSSKFGLLGYLRKNSALYIILIHQYGKPRETILFFTNEGNDLKLNTQRRNADREFFQGSEGEMCDEVLLNAVYMNSEDLKGIGKTFRNFAHMLRDKKISYIDDIEEKQRQKAEERRRQRDEMRKIEAQKREAEIKKKQEEKKAKAEEWMHDKADKVMSALDEL